MKRQSLVAAIAALVAGSAHAQADSVTIYGRLNVDVESVKASGGSGAGVTSTARLTSNSSLIGFRGEEDLGGGMKALFQLENSVGLDTGSGTFVGRNSGVGIGGAYGTLIMGQWDTPYKASTTRLDPFGDTTIAGYGAVLYGDASNTAANAANRNSFDRRQRNVIQYWTPNVAGFSGRLAYGVNEEKGTCAVACDPKLWSLSAAYEQGPLFLGAAVEQHDEYANTATARTQDTGFKLAGSYTFGATTVSALAERLRFSGNLAATGLPKVFTVGAATEAKLDTFWLAAVHRIGAHNLRLALGKSRELKLNLGSAPGTDARYVALGYGYTFSKRTEAYAMFTKISNGGNSRNDFAVNGIGGVTNGASPQGLAVGMIHSF
ncbi:porin [Noviherbaspirillum galbum]|uniref:Porin n=1 Tax=Noviherbaspirillum galbum TaxID=2709383 RepID=A0A6B3STB7_9BURK|nr:porin [Noviherbaspirillum galbum]NEX63738.1 porin [Noviherbaspirillum galbum]